MNLTTIEIKILKCLSKGLCTQDIAKKLKYAPTYIDNKITAMLRICDAKTRAQLVYKAVTEGLIR